MHKQEGSWWGWVVAAVVLFVVLPRLGVSALPFVIMMFVLINVLGSRRRRVAHRPRTGLGQPPPHGHGRGHGHGQTPVEGPGQPYGTPPPDRPMTTIDVPRFPGEAAAPTPPPTPPPTPAPPAPTPAPPGASGPPQSSTDPVVSLGQLHLARCGRDLRAAVEQGGAADVTRVLDEIADLTTRMQAMLGAGGDPSGSERKEFRAGLRAVDALVSDARGEDPPGARLTRLTQACLRMGQTGRHE